MDVRQRLTQRLNELAARDASLQEHLRNRGGRQPEQLQDWMTLLENDEVVEVLDRTTRERMAAVREALQRLDDGVYGRSVVSGEPIEPERLEVLPEARLTAQEAWERAERPAAAQGSTRKAERLEDGPRVDQPEGPVRSVDTRAAVPSDARGRRAGASRVERDAERVPGSTSRRPSGRFSG